MPDPQDIALGNTYYMALLAKNEKSPGAASLGQCHPPAVSRRGGRGTHINISGIALTKPAPNRANAVALMEFLASEKGAADLRHRQQRIPRASEGRAF